MPQAIISIEARDEFTKEFRRIRQEVARATTDFRRLTSSVGRGRNEFRNYNSAVSSAVVSNRALNTSITDAVIGFDFLFHSIRNSVGAIVDISARTERYQSVLRITEGDTGALFQRLQQLNRELIGTDFDTINRAFLNFRAAGTDIDSAITSITGFSRAMGQLNVQAFDQARFFVQLRDLYSQNRLELDDFKILQNVLPNILGLSSRALGQQIQSYDQLKTVLEDSNVSAREYFDTLGEFASINIQGIDTSTFTAQSELLRETLREIARDIGQILLPILTASARELRLFLQSFSRENIGQMVAFSVAMAAITPIIASIAQGLVGLTALMRAQIASQELLANAILAANFQWRVAATSIRTFAASIATAQIAMSAWLSIIIATTTAIALLSVRAAVAANSASDIANAFARGAEAFRFDAQLDRVRRLTDLSLAELQRLRSGHEEARRLVIGAADEIAERYGNIRDGIQLLNATASQLNIAGVTGDTLEEVERLRTQYGIAQRGITTFTEFINRLKGAQDEVTSSTNSLNAAVASLNTTLAGNRLNIDNLQRQFEGALIGADQGEIRRTAQNLIDARRQQVQTEFRIFAANEDNKGQLLAKDLELRRRLGNEAADITEQVEQRIGEIRTSRVTQYLNFERAAAEARERAYTESERRITDNYIQNLQERERVRQIALETAPDLQARAEAIRFLRGIDTAFDPTFGQAGIARLEERARTARQRADFQSRLDFEDRLPDPVARQQEIDREIAQGAQEARDAEVRAAREANNFVNRIDREGNRQRLRNARRTAREITQLFSDVVIERNITVQEGVIRFVQASARRILQSFIETRLLIANERSLRREIERTIEARRQAGLSTGLAAVSTVPGPLQPVAGAIAATQQIVNLIKFGPAEARELTNYTTQLGNSGRL